MIIDSSTGEILREQRLPAIPEPTSLAYPVSRVCEDVVAWAETVDDVAAITDAKHKLEAIDLYLQRSSTEGRGQVAAAMRRLEVRVGALLGVPHLGTNQHSEPLLASKGSLSPKERNQFRRMADHPEVVDEVIAESSDDEPASRRKVLSRIADYQAGVAAGRAAGAAASIPQRADPATERAAEAWQLAQTRLSAWNVLARRAIQCSGHLAVDDHYREPNVWGATIRSAREALDQIEETLTNRAPMRRVK